MKLAVFQVDAFAERVFSGNPAAVCPLDTWLPCKTMQAIAEENNLSETAFFVRNGKEFDIRWFTPTAEVDLCGHATLAAAKVLHTHFKTDASFSFSSASGALPISFDKEIIWLDFPLRAITAVPPSSLLLTLFTHSMMNFYQGHNVLIIEVDSEQAVHEMTPNLDQITKMII